MTELPGPSLDVGAAVLVFFASVVAWGASWEVKHSLPAVTVGATQAEVSTWQRMLRWWLIRLPATVLGTVAAALVILDPGSPRSLLLAAVMLVAAVSASRYHQLVRVIRTHQLLDGLVGAFALLGAVLSVFTLGVGLH